MTPFGSQRGVALLIVLMIVALVTVLATQMGTRLQLQIQRTMNIKDSNQAYWYAMGAEAFARKSVTTLMEETGDKISIDQPWAKAFTYPIEGGGIQARLEDMQSCFNLNALAEQNNNKNQQQASEPMEAFHHMLLSSGFEINSYTADTVRDSLADWLDSDDSMRPYGAEDSEYESREFPYLAANNLMSSQSEIRLVNGVEASWINDILPLICVIPDVDSLAINVNTLTEERAAVLAGATGLSLQQAKSLISSRPQEGWDDVNDFLNEPVLAAMDLDETRRKWFTITSEYFILHTKTRYNKASFSLTSVLHVQGEKEVKVLRREFGGVE
ncbi:type II secretion system minor pseudopilin GspK [Alteromonas pelagimontana]|uniref:Type II secretion system protein K n=1 Tax=Alteromonas pelagimontana TaxID=1858656 RepID=A0A6M4MCL7_9ALTE|nr:type II secretion system minor pseudopilin GspK [Alteromonas pelagimontana]QJR80819.1 type II secretion system minor pseudopilin GspK [Alteromonas pelagimontana]